MDDRLSAEAILDHLGALAEWLRVKAPDERHLLYVVGGAALALSGIARTTYDVDLLRPAQLTRSLKDGARAVARSRHLAPEWLGTGPAEIIRQLRLPAQLPEYFFQSTRSIPIGDNLVVEVASRQALLSLKLFAASPSTGKHLDDLRALAPNRDELLEALRFALEMDSSEPRRCELRTVLAELESASSTDDGAL